MVAIALHTHRLEKGEYRDISKHTEMSYKIFDKWVLELIPNFWDTEGELSHGLHTMCYSILSLMGREGDVHLRKSYYHLAR